MLTLEQLQEIQEEYLADDIAIDLERMSLWTSEQAAAYFESGGEDEPAPPMAPMGGKELDIVIVGATGVVGSWCCQMLAECANASSRTAQQLLGKGESPPKWGIAGRRSKKLEALASKYGVRCLVVEEGQPATFDAVTAAASLVVAVAGPYRQAFGMQLLAACARAKGVVYFDLTGEYTQVADGVARLDAEAKANGTALVHMAGPQECCITEVCALLASRALQDAGGSVGSIEILTAGVGGMMSGGTVASGMAMRSEEDGARLADPWLLMPADSAVRADTESEPPSEWVNDFDEVLPFPSSGDSIWLSPSFLGKGNVRMFRRAAELARERRLAPHWLPPTNGPSALAVREKMYHKEKMKAYFVRMAVNEAPAKTRQAVESGKLPRQGFGPDPEQSKATTFTDWAVASTAVDGGVGKTASCCVRAPRNVGHGIGCGYAGSAYCLLSCALTARAKGGVPAERCGAGLTPAGALDFDEHVARMKRVGYLFEVLPRAPTASDLDAAIAKMEAV